MKSFHHYSIAFLVLSVLIVGCSYNPGPNLSGPGKTVPPKAGSTYTFKNVQTDTNGTAMEATATYTRDSVAATGMDTLGKKNVTHIISIDTTYGYFTDSYLNFESNGDISMYVGGNGGGGFGGVTLPDWATYPMQSHTTIGMKIGDTTVTFPGIPLPIPIKVYDSMFYVSSGTYAVGNIPVFNMKEVITINATLLFAPITSTQARHISFAPSLGYIISDIQDPFKSPVSQLPSQGGSQTTLVSYKLK